MERYAEVFGGAMWVYLKSDFIVNEVFYNDVNPFMANLFHCCKYSDEMYKNVKNLQPQNENLFNEYKEEIIELFGMSDFNIPDFNIAKKYAYIVTQIFSGIVNRKSKMVDLKGKYKSKFEAFVKRLENSEIKEKLSKIEVSNLSYDEFIKGVDGSDSYFYLDPPYYGTENLYDFHSFTKDNHRHLLEILKNEINGKWVLSYYEFDLLKEMFPEEKYQWERKEYKKASMASKGKNQSIGTEVLVLSKNINIL